jgi:hypothetical protein
VRERENEREREREREMRERESRAPAPSCPKIAARCSGVFLAFVFALMSALYEINMST